MATVGSLVIGIQAKTEEFERAIDKATKKIERFANKMQSVGASLAATLTAPIVAAGVAAVHTAEAFDQSFNVMEGVIGLSTQEVRRLKEEVLALSGGVAKSPKELAEALLQVSQAGFRGRAAVDVLTVAAKASTAGLGETKAIADALTGAINAYGASNLTAARAASVLIVASRSSRKSAMELAPAIGSILPVASQLGIGMEQVAAAMASMTRAGLETGAATTGLRTVLAAILKPSQDAQKALGEMGLNADKLRQQISEQGLLSVLETLRGKFASNQDALTRVFPNVKALAGVLSLVGGNAAATREIFGQLAAVTENDLNRAFAVAASDSSFKFQQALAAVQASLIRLGEAVLPVILPLVGALTLRIQQAAEAFARLSPEAKTLMVVGAGLAAALGPALLAFSAFVGSAATALKVVKVLVASFGALFAIVTGPGILALVGLGVAAVMVINKWEELKASFSQIIDFMAEKVKGTLVDKVLTHLGNLFTRAREILGRFGIILKEVAAGTGEEIAAQVSKAAATLTTGLAPTVNGFLERMKAAAAGVVASFQSLGQAAVATAEFVGPPLSGMGAALVNTATASQTAWERFTASFALAREEMRTGLINIGLFSVQTTDQWRASMQAIGQETASAMGATAAAFARGAINVGQFVEKMVRAIGNLIAKLLILKGIQTFLPGLGGPFASAFVGGLNLFANGGRPAIGRAAIVGEEGPELFVPDTAGRIVPLEGSRGGSNQPVTISQNFTLQGFDLSSEEQIRRVMNRFMGEMKAGSLQAIQLARASAELASLQARRAV